ncbi:MAG: hypothetical protein QOH73_1480, partial [Gaiellaceae bacterium]|nr:hypothetical protein [Gaiellaceae bacterium]
MWPLRDAIVLLMRETMSLPTRLTITVITSSTVATTKSASRW